MPVSVREYRARIRAVESTRKITRAMELIAASRRIKAQQRAASAEPYRTALTFAVSAAATHIRSDHPLLSKIKDSNRAAVLVVTSDRGLAGGYSAAVLKETERLLERIRQDGREAALYVSGRKGLTYLTYRQRPIAQSWTGHSENPPYELAREIAHVLIEQFLIEGTGVDDVFVVYTRFRSLLTQEQVVVRLLPPEVVEGVTVPDDAEMLPLYEFEPSAEVVLDTLLWKYVTVRIHFALLQAAASEIAARQRAMKSATDNATDLIEKYTRIANQARQAAITQEISEIVGGADALADNVSSGS